MLIAIHQYFFVILLAVYVKRWNHDSANYFQNFLSFLVLKLKIFCQKTKKSNKFFLQVHVKMLTRIVYIGQQMAIVKSNIYERHIVGDHANQNARTVSKYFFPH